MPPWARIARMKLQRLSTSLVAVTLVLGGGLACRYNAPGAGGSADDAKAFLTEANDTILRLSNEANQAGWTYNTFITPDTEAMSARANERFSTAVTTFAKRAAEFDDVELDAESRRQMTVLKNSLVL